MSYTRVLWEDSPSQSTALNAENLNIMDEAIETLDQNVTQLLEDTSSMQEDIEDIKDNADTLFNNLEQKVVGVSRLTMSSDDWSNGSYAETSGMEISDVYSVRSTKYNASDEWDVAFTGTCTDDTTGDIINNIFVYCWGDSSKFLGRIVVPTDKSYVSLKTGTKQIAFAYAFTGTGYYSVASYGFDKTVARIAFDVRNAVDKINSEIESAEANISANTTSIATNTTNIATNATNIASIKNDSGVIDYPKLKNIPTINSIEITGAKTGNDLGVIDMPTSNGQKTYGTSGQILSTNGDGTASWVDGFPEGKIVTGKFNYWSTNSKIITNAANITLTTGVWLVIYSFHINNYESEEIEVTLHFDDYPDGYTYGSTVIASVDENDLKSGKYSNISRIINVTDESVTLNVYGSSSVTITDSRTLQGSISAVLLTPSSTATSTSTDSGTVDPQTDEEQGIATYDEDDELL